jgi:hypothetical protein
MSPLAPKRFLTAFSFLFVALAFCAQPGAAATNAGPRVVASIVLGTNVITNALMQVNQNHDGATVASEMEGRECHALQRYPGRPELYVYFRLDSSLKVLPGKPALVAVEYFDAAPGHFVVDYDGNNDTARNPAFSRTRTRVDLKGDQRWHHAAILMEDPRFEQRQNDGGDFRIAVISGQFFVRTVKFTQE